MPRHRHFFLWFVNPCKYDHSPYFLRSFLLVLCPSNPRAANLVGKSIALLHDISMTYQQEHEMEGGGGGGAWLDMTSVQQALNTIDSISSDKIIYSEEELATMRLVQQELKEKDGLKSINLRFLAYTVLVSKNRSEEAIKKYRQFLKATKPCGVDLVETDQDLWKDPQVHQFLREFYVPCGMDYEGRQIMWIRGDKPIPPELEATSVRAGILYVLAIHGDVKSLREGITFVIDTSKRGSFKSVGNESKLQKVNQSYPLRPQAILIAGASPTMRIVINGLIRIASLFTKQKILQRIHFVSLEQAMESIPKQSGPAYLGGGGGGIEDLVEWTKRRYESLPVPDL
jgi:hypothetical protein